MTTLPKQLRPRKEPRQHRARETRRRVLDAAARVFAEHGYAAGTTNRIAGAAGMSVGSLYQYFPNKDSILVELVRAHVAEGMAAVQGLLAGADPDTDPGTDGGSDGDNGAGRLPVDTTERLRLFVRAAIRAHAGNTRLHRVLFEESPRPRELLDELHALESATVEAVARILEQDPAVHTDDPRLTAWIVITSIESLTHRYVSSHPDDLDLPGFEREVVALLAGYLT